MIYAQRVKERYFNKVSIEVTGRKILGFQWTEFHLISFMLVK